MDSLQCCRCLHDFDLVSITNLSVQHHCWLSNSFCNRYAGRCLFVKVDADKCEALAQSFGIRAMPTFVMLTKNGDKLDEVRGTCAVQSWSGQMVLCRCTPATKVTRGAVDWGKQGKAGEDDRQLLARCK